MDRRVRLRHHLPVAQRIPPGAGRSERKQSDVGPVCIPRGTRFLTAGAGPWRRAARAGPAPFSLSIAPYLFRPSPPRRPYAKSRILSKSWAKKRERRGRPRPASLRHWQPAPGKTAPRGTSPHELPEPAAGASPAAPGSASTPRPNCWPAWRHGAGIARRVAVPAPTNPPCALSPGVFRVHPARAGVREAALLPAARQTASGLT
jgi:hypothetical protein